jgi:hypothetical protein
MKKMAILVGLIIFAGSDMDAQNITWNISGANPSQYIEITKDELFSLFNKNQLGNNQKYKIVIDSEGYLTEAAASISLLALLSSSAAGIEYSNKSLYFEGVINTYEKIEIYFSQGVKYNTLKIEGHNLPVQYPVIPVDGYRLIK